MITKTFDLRGRKLFVATPTYDYRISISASISMMRLAALCMKEGVALGHHPLCGSSIITMARNMLADLFLKSDATDLLFLDSDINFNADDVLRLLALTTDHAIVAGVPRRRGDDKAYLAKFEQEQGNYIVNELGILKANHVATAFMMVQRKVFETMREAHPEWKHYNGKLDRDIYAFFDFAVSPEGYKGEDFLFCERARTLGFEIWVDPSIKLGHMGIMEFKADLQQTIIDGNDKDEVKPMESAA